MNCRSKTPYRWARKALLFLLRVTVHNEDQLSAKLEKGRAVVCSNHVSYLDGIIISLASAPARRSSIHSELTLELAAVKSWPKS